MRRSKCLADGWILSTVELLVLRSFSTSTAGHVGGMWWAWTGWCEACGWADRTVPGARALQPGSHYGKDIAARGGAIQGGRHPVGTHSIFTTLCTTKPTFALHAADWSFLRPNPGGRRPVGAHNIFTTLCTTKPTFARPKAAQSSPKYLQRSPKVAPK